MGTALTVVLIVLAFLGVLWLICYLVVSLNDLFRKTARVADAKPYWGAEKLGTEKRKANAVPAKPGIYLLMRRVNVKEDGYGQDESVNQALVIVPRAIFVPVRGVFLQEPLTDICNGRRLPLSGPINTR